MTRALVRARRAALVLSVAAACAACRQLGLQDRPMPILRESVMTTNGVNYTDTFLGHGLAARTGDELVVDYTLWLEKGERVDSTLDRGVPLTLELGAAALPGLDDGLISVQPGGRRRVVVPARLAYGEAGVEGMIPPNSNLVFEVHVIEVRPRPAKSSKD